MTGKITEYEFELPLKNEDELRLFVEKTFGVHIPNTQVCEHHSTPWRAFADAYFCKAPVAVWLASRGLGGKSWLLSMLSLVEALTQKANVNLLGGSGEQSRRVLEHLGNFWRYPNAQTLVAGQDISLVVRDVARSMDFGWNNKVEALTASQTSVRGPHPEKLRLDECDEMDLAILDAAMGQPMSRGSIQSQVVQSSTHQYSDKTFTECLARAAKYNFPVYVWCFKENLQPHGWLSQEEVDRKRAQMSEQAFVNEVELQEPSPESRAISTPAVQRMFKRSLGYFAGTVRENIEIEPPLPTGLYAHGADWAKQVDRTILTTYRIDVRPIRLVSFMALQREEYPIMVGEFAKRIARYGGSSCFDQTGLGDVVADILKEYGVLSEGVQMRGQTRAGLLSNYIKAIEADLIEAPFIRSVESEHRLASVQAIYQGGTTQHLPDSIASGALAYRAARMGVAAEEWIRASQSANAQGHGVFDVEKLKLGQGHSATVPYVTTESEIARRLGVPALGQGLPAPKAATGLFARWRH